MPVMDGVEMLTRLKADPDLRSIPVVMLTAESGRDNVIRIAKLGVRDYLIKPFKEELIVERVGRIIELKSSTEAAPRVKRFDDPLNILIVDDKPAIVDQIRAGLAGTPWKVSAVSQAGQAVDFCSQSLPDIIMVSLSLGENAGFMLFQVFRASAKTKSIPVLALSVKTASDEQLRAQQVGFNGIVTKPIDFEDLKARISRALALDTSYRYFQRNNSALILTLPAGFNQAAANEITLHLRPKLCEAVDAGLSRLIIDMSQPKTADVALIKLGLGAIQLCTELDIRYTMVGSEAVSHECKIYEETKNWQFVATLEEAMSSTPGKAAAPAAATPAPANA